MTEYASLPDVARRSAQRYAAHPALVRAAKAGGGGLTYAELWTSVEAGARTLRASGLASGDRVLLASPPQPLWTSALLAILEAGLVAVPSPPGLDATRLADVAAFAGARVAIVDGTTQLPPLLTIPLTNLFVAPSSDAAWTRPVRSDTALLVFTSGSTSNPRAVELTHGNVLADLEAMLTLRHAAPGDSFLSMLPPSHMFELVGGTLGPLACGARVVYPGAILPNRVVAALRDERITYALAVPALLDALFREVRSGLEAAGAVTGAPAGAGPDYAAQQIANASSADRDALRDAVRAAIGPSLHTLIVGGAALAPAWGELLAAVGIRLEVGYGLTEASPIVTIGVAGESPRGSVGRPLPGVDIRIGDGDEILVRGANVMRGYYRDPAAARETLANGWLRTGDVGRIDAAGFLFIDGRIKEAMVSSTGETVYPPLYVVQQDGSRRPLNEQERVYQVRGPPQGCTGLCRAVQGCTGLYRAQHQGTRPCCMLAAAADGHLASPPWCIRHDTLIGALSTSRGWH